MDDTTAKLASHIVATRFEDLPSTALHECKRRIIDSIACAAAAYGEPFTQGLRHFAGRYSGTPAARVWGSGAPTSVEMAAFTNGTMVRYLDYSDTYLGKSAGHPSDMIAGLLALAEARSASGREVLRAIIIAYEIYCGLCQALSLQAHALDQASCAAIGTAAGAACLLGLDEKGTQNALSLGLAPCLNLFNVRAGVLSDWKGCAGPNGARNGIFAALLAAEGITGPTAPIEGKGGLWENTTRFDWTWSLKGDALIEHTHLKFHPVCYHGQTAIDAAIALRPALRLADIESIQVDTYEAAFKIMAADSHRWAPANRETADHSIPFTLAITLTDGRLGSEAYSEVRMTDPAIKRLMNKVKVSVNADMNRAFPEKIQTRLTIREHSGAVHSHLQDYPKGHAKNPLSDAEVEEKLMQSFAAWGDEHAARRVLAQMWKFEALERVGDLVDSLCHAR